MMVLPSGLAVLEPASDSLLSRWIELDGSLSSYDARIRDVFCPLIPKGGVVVDAGACLGTHAVAYADAVGPEGRVLAFEPNPAAAACLRWNTAWLSQVEVWPAALTDAVRVVHLATSDYNAGGATVTSPEAGNLRAPGLPLDAVFVGTRLDYLKIDVEGHELASLRGAEATIRIYHPVIVMEAGREAAALALLSQWGYQWEQAPMEVSAHHRDPDPSIYDIIARWSP